MMEEQMRDNIEYDKMEDYFEQKRLEKKEDEYYERIESGS